MAAVGQVKLVLSKLEVAELEVVKQAEMALVELQGSSGPGHQMLKARYEVALALAKQWTFRKGKRMDEFEAVGEVIRKIRARIGEEPDQAEAIATKGAQVRRLKSMVGRLQETTTMLTLKMILSRQPE
ncbi:MAG: hypothetical protein MI674_05090 [Cytophagales bacterium]|nr:hypothetical protein [Cytophagales bacterium]